MNKTLKVLVMSALFCHLSSFNGFEWRLSFLNNSYLASYLSGCCSIGSSRIDFSISSGGKTFYVYLSEFFIEFPISELKKFKEFNKQVQVFKAAA